ncbi:MAG: LPS-assembly protein LptD [Prevotellaceae bacterium]|nr:LPS-assembly protein LptD [Prevotellaceae bacterium]
MKARLLSILTVCYVLASLAAQPAGGVAFSMQDKADTLLADTLPSFSDSLLLQADSIASHPDSVPRRAYTILPDSVPQDTVPPDTMPKSKNALDMPVTYSAEDSITFDYRRSRAHLYGGSKVNYQNLELEAELIQIAIDSSLVHATSRTDSTGAVIGKPLFRQGTEEYEPDSISYNFKSRKAYISNVYTQQGEGYMKGLDGKRDSVGTMYVQKAYYSTCDAPHPHFYLNMTRAKMRPGKDVVFGPTYLVVEDVPLPLAIPYGFFPFKSKYSSGFIMPSYGDETSRGFYLRDGGYYFAINDYVDLKVLGEIYTKGSWALSGQSTYRKRYRFSGNVYVSYQHTQTGEKNMPDFTVSKSFKLTWSHRQDAKANPTQSFSASVNFATSSYERNNLTSMYNPESYTQSTRTSSISYSKTFSDIGLTLSGTFNLSQNVRDSSISVTLPTLNIQLNRFNPLKRKKMVGKERWYEKIALSYSGTLSNSINTKENLLFKSSLVRDWRNGMRHQVPVSASFTVAKYINVTPNFSFTDRMYTNKVMQSWDQERNAVSRDTLYGFYNVYNFNMSLSANTKLYGFYTPMPWFGGKKIKTVRHMVTPSVSFSYAPDFSKPRWGFYDSYVRTDANGNVSTVTYSPFSGGVYGTAGSGMTGSVQFDVSNNLEMKLRSSRDSTGEKKISLIDELGFSLGYNMAAKRQPWSDLNTRLRLKLTKSYTFSLNAVFATYAYEFDENGRVYVGDNTEWSKGRFGRFQGMSQNLSYTFNNQTLRKLLGMKVRMPGRSSARDSDGDDDEDDDETDPNMQNVDPERKKGMRGAERESTEETDADGYLKFQMPWSLSVSYGVTMREDNSATINPRTMRYPYKFTQTLNFSGNVRISEGWNINFSSGYDFNYKKLSMTTVSLSRDLHCFSMSCSMVISPYTSFNFLFAAKAGTLADALRWRKQSSYSSNIEWY